MDNILNFLYQYNVVQSLKRRGQPSILIFMLNFCILSCQQIDQVRNCPTEVSKIKNHDINKIKTTEVTYSHEKVDRFVEFYNNVGMMKFNLNRHKFTQCRFKGKSLFALKEFLSIDTSHFYGATEFYDPNYLTTCKLLRANQSDFDNEVKVTNFESEEIILTNNRFLSDFIFNAVSTKFLTTENNFFCKTVIFWRCEYESASFYGSNFLGDSLIFDYTKFRNTPNLAVTYLPKTIVFRNITTRHWSIPLDLRLCNFSDSSNFKASKSTIIFENKTPNIPFDFDASRFIIPFDKFDLKFKNIPLGKQLLLLTQLKIVSDSIGDKNSSEQWDIRYKQIDKVYNYGPTLGSIFNCIEAFWWNFGYSKWLIVVVWMPVFFIAFWIITYLRLPKIVKEIYSDPELGANFVLSHLKSEDIHPEKNRNRVISHIIANRFGYSLFLTAAIYFGFKIKHEAVNYGNVKGIIYIYTMYLVGFFMVAYTIAFFFK